MGGLNNPEDGKFNFKIKITQTDLACQEYLFGAGFDEGVGFGGGDPGVYQNSSYISKLFFINSYSGGILAKEKTEELPDRYRWFMKSDYPTEEEIFRSFKKEMAVLANREAIGQNVFYSGLSVQPPPQSQSYAEASNQPVSDGAAGKSALAERLAECIGSFDSFESFVSAFEEFGANGNEGARRGGWDFSEDDEYIDLDDLDLEEDGESFPEKYEEYEEYEDYEDYGDYADDEEIKNILFMNNVYNSEMYKMSKVEYDFSVPGNISMTDDGSLNIKYDESEITGLKDSYIQFLFHADNRDIVTIRRKHFFDTWFTLEKGKRVSIERRCHDSGEVLTTSTKELVNNMTLDGGNLRIAYATETDGVPTESVIYSIRAEPMPEI